MGLPMREAEPMKKAQTVVNDVRTIWRAKWGKEPIRNERLAALAAVVVAVLGVFYYIDVVTLCLVAMMGGVGYVAGQPHRRPPTQVKDVAPPQPREQEEKEAFASRMRTLLNAEWTALSSDSRMKILTRDVTMPSGRVVTGYRFEVVRDNVDAENVVEALCNTANWEKIDPNLERVTESQQTPGLYQVETRRVAVVSPRVGYVSFHREEDDSRTYVGFMGASSGDFNPISKTEATIWLDGTMVESTETGCRCVYFSVMDPNLWVPIPHAVATNIVIVRLQNLEKIVRANHSPPPTELACSPPTALCACAQSHGSWRSVSHEDSITMWQGTGDGVRIRGSMFIKAQPRLLQKLVSLPSLQYELMPWLVKSDTIQTHGSIRYTNELWRVPSPYFGFTTRGHSVRHYDAVEIDDTIIVAMSSSSSEHLENRLCLQPSGWIINYLGEEAPQCHVEFILQLSYTNMPTPNDAVLLWGRRRVQQMLQQLRLLS